MIWLAYYHFRAPKQIATTFRRIPFYNEADAE